MAIVVTQPLSNIIPISVTIGAVPAAANPFNRGLIVGPTPVIPSYGANSRVRNYPNTTAMTADGFQLTDPEYLAAEDYFGQTPAPQYLSVGRQDLTALQTVVPTGGSSGQGCVVGDVFNVIQNGASFGQVKVLAETAGAATSLGVVTLAQGTGYSVATGLATQPVSGASGSNLSVDVSAIGETGAQAVQACRIQDTTWYPCTVTDAGDADILAIAGFIEAASPASAYVTTVSDSGVFGGLANNVLLQLQALQYKRTMVVAATTQSGLFPGNAYAGAAAMGRAMGLNTGLANSNFTLMFKTLVGIAADPLTFTQISTVQNSGGNELVNYQNGSYIFLQNGQMVNGSYFDQLIGLDQLSNDIQVSLMNLYTSLPSVPLDQTGGAMLVGTVQGCCARSRTRGFLAPGVWNGATILNLSSGQSLPSGYYVQTDSYQNITPAMKQQRQSMPVYCAVLLAEASHGVQININVQQ